MTTFTNGPALSARLMLRRAPQYLRVVQDAKGKWDALDQIGDAPKADETVFVYEINEKPGHCHIRASGGRSGFYSVASYRFVEPQPREEQMRTEKLWHDWVMKRVETHPRPDLK